MLSRPGSTAVHAPQLAGGSKLVLENFLVPTYMRVALQLGYAVAPVYENECHTTTVVINSADIAP